ncbi:MAG TPA: HEAT repeat domain-containing protein [Candidatus Sulfotelmatobacter sp.]|nr:HEAT repeat domain-containing protein [Candidatus Sulfotelmatobacter sp.]
MRTLVLLTIALSCWISRNVLAQQPQQAGTVKLYRYGDLLREHGVALTEPALLNALKNPDASVRYLAAMKLAEDKLADAIPAMEQALVVEKSPRARVNIALALALLGDQVGNAELKKICADKNFIPEFRLYAVRYMFELHAPKDEGCLKATEDTIELQNANFGDLTSALELLTQFHDLTEEQSRKVLKLAARRLEDPEPVVRMAASHSLAGLGNVAAAPYLEVAITKEQDESVRSVLQNDLGKLRKTTEP